MSTGYHKGTTHVCNACGRMSIHSACCCNETRTSPRKKEQPRQTQEKSDFWSHDHFGLMEKYKR